MGVRATAQLRAADSRADNRRELLRLETAIKALGKFAPADEGSVRAAKTATDRARKLEADIAAIQLKLAPSAANSSTTAHSAK